MVKKLGLVCLLLTFYSASTTHQIIKNNFFGHRSRAQNTCKPPMKPEPDLGDRHPQQKPEPRL